MKYKSSTKSYDELLDILTHFPAFGLEVSSVYKDEYGFYIIELSGPIPEDQLEHLGLIIL